MRWCWWAGVLGSLSHERATKKRPDFQIRNLLPSYADEYYDYDYTIRWLVSRTPKFMLATHTTLLICAMHIAQDELGQACFGYAHPGQAATNYRDVFGNQIGNYTYLNPEGKKSAFLTRPIPPASASCASASSFA